MTECTFDLVITRKEFLTAGVVQLTLARVDGAELPGWEPGAHIDLQVVSKEGSYIRQYSLCGSVIDRHHWTIAVLHVPDGRGGSDCIHKMIAEGSGVKSSAPRNNFPLAPAKSYLFIAGGIGITPMLPMIKKATASGAEWSLVYCGRSLALMPFVTQLAALEPGKILLHESSRKGRMDLGALISNADPEALIYCCGPESMLQAVESASLSSDRIHLERFSAKDIGGTEGNEAFEVEFARSGLVATVPPDRSILEVAEDLGIEIESSCQEGVCRSCETAVISGTPDHRDSVLTARERAAGKCMMVCVSRSNSQRLVLDV